MSRKNQYNSFDANKQNNYSNIPEAFAQNTPFIPKIDYSNQNNFLHNNVGDTLLNENVNEYNIYIDSDDRDKIAYYSPFNFKISFCVNGDIDSDIKNVKYINLNYIILPPSNILYAHTEIQNSISIFDQYLINSKYNSPPTLSLPTGTKWPIQNSILTKNRYIILKIKELDNCRVKSTGQQSIDKNSFVLFYDDDVKDENNNITGTIWKPKFGGGSRVFLSSLLKTVKNFTISIHDQYGNLITPIDNTLPSVENEIIDMIPNDGSGIKISTGSGINISTFTYYKSTEHYPTSYSDYTQARINNVSSTVDKSKPNIKLLGNYFEKNFNVQLGFTFGVVESELNTLTKYYR